MTNEEHIEELLMESEFYGIRKEVLELSHKMKEENPMMDKCVSIERALSYMKEKLENKNLL